MDRIVLRETRDATGVRYLEARREADGAVVIEGQDLGDGVEAVLGDGIREYEWRWHLDPEHVPAALAALDSPPGEDILAALARWSAVAGGRDPGTRIRDAGVPIGFDSRMGD